MRYELLDDFENPEFIIAFKRYFAELDISVKDWGSLFSCMNNEENFAIVYSNDEGKIEGFIQCQPICSESWFFTERYGFIREFWVSPERRRQGIGTELLSLAEKQFSSLGIRQYILTTDTAEFFYTKRGYKKRDDVIAKNGDPTYVKSN